VDCPCHGSRAGDLTVVSICRLRAIQRPRSRDAGTDEVNRSSSFAAGLTGPGLVAILVLVGPGDYLAASCLPCREAIGDALARPGRAWYLRRAIRLRSLRRPRPNASALSVLPRMTRTANARFTFVRGSTRRPRRFSRPGRSKRPARRCSRTWILTLLDHAVFGVTLPQHCRPWRVQTLIPVGHFQIPIISEPQLLAESSSSAAVCINHLVASCARDLSRVPPVW